MARFIESGHRDNGSDYRKVADEIVDRFDVSTIFGSTTFPDHDSGRCWDFMVYSDRDTGDGIAEYLLQHRDRLGTYFMIWNRRVIRSYDKPGIPAWTWARYTGAHPHTDHVHWQGVTGYDYRPAVKPKRAGRLYSVTKDGTWAREKPHARTPTARRRAGFTVRIVGQKTTRHGVKWGRASGGKWYRMDALARKLPGRLYVTTADLNARTGAGTSHRVVRTWPKGTTLRIARIRNGWAEGTGGLYMSADYLKEKR